MSAETTRVECDRRECAFYSEKPGDDMCHCKHPDKPRHLYDKTCPLYRLDWQKKRKGS